MSIELGGYNLCSVLCDLPQNYLPATRLNVENSTIDTYSILVQFCAVKHAVTPQSSEVQVNGSSGISAASSIDNSSSRSIRQQAEYIKCSPLESGYLNWILTRV
jgi:hypothetical protein